jgi:hypothetical protein
MGYIHNLYGKKLRMFASFYNTMIRKCSYWTFIIIIVSGSTVLVRALAPSHRRFRNLIKTFCRTTLAEWSARRKGLYLHKTRKHINTKTNIQALSVIRTHDPSNQTTETYAIDLTVTRTSYCVFIILKYRMYPVWTILSFMQTRMIEMIYFGS